MEWLLELNRSLDYIEEQLEGNMQLEQIAGEAAKIARCSAYHYQRIFSYLAGMTLSEYLRRRRMTLAAGHLRAGEKVLDTALFYGYDSPTAFNRAFQTVHGVTPSEAKKEGVKLKAYPRSASRLRLRGQNRWNIAWSTNHLFMLLESAVLLGLRWNKTHRLFHRCGPMQLSPE